MTDVVSVAPTAAPATPRAGVAVSIVSQLAAKGVHLVLNVISSVAIVRYLGPRGFGDFVAVTTTATLAGLVADFGLSKLAVREIARDEDSASSVLGSTIAARLGLSVGAFVLAQLVLLALGVRAELHVAAAVLSVLYLTESLFTLLVMFHVRLQQQYEAFVRTFAELVETVLTLLLIAVGATLIQLLSVQVAAAVVGVVIAVGLFRRKFGLRLAFDRARTVHMLRVALPVGVAMIVGILYLRIDNLMITAMRPRREVGLYGVAYQPIEYLLLSTAVLVNVRLPLLSRSFTQDAAAFQREFRRGTELLVLLVMPVPALLLAIAPGLIALVYSTTFAAATLPLRLLGVALVFMVINTWNGFVLLAADEQKVTLWYSTAALIASAALNAALIPAVGYVGAAYATAISAAGVCAWSTVVVWRRTGAGIAWRRILRIAGANVALAACAWTLVTSGLNWVLASIGAGLLYVALLRVLGMFGVSHGTEVSA